MDIHFIFQRNQNEKNTNTNTSRITAYKVQNQSVDQEVVLDKSVELTFK